MGLMKRLQDIKIDTDLIRQIIIPTCSDNKFPIFSSKAPAGFPSPADDYIEAKLSLDEIIIKHPSATFLIRVSGHSMINEGIHNDDILVVDRSVTPQDGKIAVVAIDGEITVKKLKIIDGKLFLAPANSRYQPIEVKQESDVTIWGIVITVLHNF